MTDHTDLIKRLEAADGPTTALFHEAYRAVFGASPWTDKYESGTLGSRTDRGVRARCERFAEFVRVEAWESAALTLVPEGWRAGFEMGGYHDDPTDISQAWVWPFESSYDPDWQLGQETQRSNPDGFIGTAKNPALAICIAALKAQD